MVKLISNVPGTKWATRDLTQIYGGVVWCGEDEIKYYVLIDADHNIVKNPDYRIEKIETSCYL